MQVIIITYSKMVYASDVGEDMQLRRLGYGLMFLKPLIMPTSEKIEHGH